MARENWISLTDMPQMHAVLEVLPAPNKAHRKTFGLGSRFENHKSVEVISPDKNCEETLKSADPVYECHKIYDKEYVRALRTCHSLAKEVAHRLWNAFI